MKNLLMLLCLVLLSVNLSLAQEKAYVLASDEGVEMDKGFGAEFKATPKTTGGKYLFTITLKPGGFRTPIHKQSRDLSFYVLEGELSIYFNSEIHVLTPGHFAFIPKGTPLAFSSTGDSGAKWVHLFTSGEGMIEFWQAQGNIGEKDLSGEETNKAIIEKAPEFGVEYVGPSPFGRNK